MITAQLSGTAIVSSIAVAIAVLSLLVSLAAALKTWRYNERLLRRATRHDHSRLLIELDRMVVDRPELWAIYDSHPLAATPSNDQLELSRRSAYVYLHLTLFEMVYDYYHNLVRMNRIDHALWKSWDLYIKDLLHDSREARTICSSDYFATIYSSGFVQYVRSIIRSQE